MIQLSHEQLDTQLNKEGLRAAYLLLGNDPLLLQESCNKIRKAASIFGFNEHYTFQVDYNTNWQEIFSLCRTISMFTIRQTIQLLLPENGFDITAVNEQMAMLANMLHNNILLIIRGNKKLIKIYEKTSWFIALSARLVQVICMTPEQINLLNWITNRAKNNNIKLDNTVCKLLCYYYEGNLLALAQVLETFSLLWPKSIISLSQAKQVINDVACFTPYHWIDAILMAKSKRALHILQQFYLENKEPLILLRTLQHELLLLVTFKKESTGTSLQNLYSKHCIAHNRRTLISKILNRLSNLQLNNAVYMLTNIELELKQDYDHLIWRHLEGISLLLCNKELANIFIYN